MKVHKLKHLATLFALPLSLLGCVGPIGSENATMMVASEQSIALSGSGLPVDVEVDLSEQHSETAYQLAVFGKESTGDWLELSRSDQSGDFVGQVKPVFPTAGVWETDLRLLEPDSAEPLIAVPGPAIEVFDEGTLNIKPRQQYDAWITGEPMPLVPSITPDKLSEEFDWTVEVLRGDDWEELVALDAASPEVPAFSDEAEGIQALRLVAFLQDKKFSEGQPFEVRIASPFSLIRELWARENNLTEPEDLWDEVSANTYPGIQYPTDQDRNEFIESYRDAMPNSIVLLETLSKVPEIDLVNLYERRPCSDPEVLEAGIEGVHFMYDVSWYAIRATTVSTFWDGRMYQHRTLCY